MELILCKNLGNVETYTKNKNCPDVNHSKTSDYYFSYIDLSISFIMWTISELETIGEIHGNLFFWALLKSHGSTK